MEKHLIIGMSGASGAPLTVSLLQQLKKYYPRISSHLIVSDGAALTLTAETGMTLADLAGLASHVYTEHDIGSAPASGSFPTLGMILIPTSMKTLAGIACGYCENLLLRAADVTIKEGRRLILVPRECPLGPIHLENMFKLSRMGVTIMPPVPDYYNRPLTVEECNVHFTARVLNQAGLPVDEQRIWTGLKVSESKDAE